MGDDTFIISGQEHPVKVPEGRAGRRAVSFLLKRLTAKEGEETIGVKELTELLDDEEFGAKHLPVLLDISKETLDTKGTFSEVLNAIMKVVSVMFESMGTEEVNAAEKK